MKIYSDLLSKAVGIAKKQNSPILAIVIGTKPDFYKQAPIVFEAAKEDLAVFVIDTNSRRSNGKSKRANYQIWLIWEVL
jgi:hypothetical protein